MRLTVEFSPFIESLLFREPLCYFRLANTQIFFIFFFLFPFGEGLLFLHSVSRSLL